MRNVDELAQELYDLLANAPDGERRDDLMDALGIAEVSLFHRVKGALQDLLGGGDTITVVGDPKSGQEGGWVYSLRADPQNPISLDYLIAKTRNIFARQKRQYMVHRALAEGTDGRTAAGRAARRLVRSQYRAMEDTVDVLVELGQSPPSMP